MGGGIALYKFTFILRASAKLAWRGDKVGRGMKTVCTNFQQIYGPVEFISKSLARKQDLYNENQIHRSVSMSLDRLTS